MQVLPCWLCSKDCVFVSACQTLGRVSSAMQRSIPVYCTRPRDSRDAAAHLLCCASARASNLAVNLRGFLHPGLKLGVLRCIYVVSPAASSIHKDAKVGDVLQVPSSVQWYHFGQSGVCSRSSRQCSGVKFILSLPQVLGWRWTEAGEIHCRHTERLCRHCCRR